MEKGQSFGSVDELQERRKKKGSLPLAVFLSFNDRDVNPQCPNACNPYHKCGWYCLDKIPSGNMLLDGGRSEGSCSDCEGMPERKGVNPSCPNASNPFHKCAEYCFEKTTGKRLDVVREPVQMKGEKMVQRTGVTPISLKALDFFHKGTEYCFRGCSTSYQEKDKAVLITGDESGVNPTCKHASNPYHKCDKFCLGNSPVSVHGRDVMKPNEQKLVRTTGRAVNSECKYASNPYHVCSEYCLRMVPESVQPRQAINPKNLMERKKIVNNTERTGVDPHCKYASNPYHKCSEYCFQNLAERDTADGHGVSKSKERKQAVGDAEKKDSKLKCKYASNPYHKCTDNCYQEISRDNPAVEGIAAQIKLKNGGERKERKADHPMMEKRSLDSDGMEASNVNHNYIDSSKGITILVGTNESESVFSKEEKEVGMIEILDSQPLRIDASELFKEWAKYCSLKASEDDEAQTEKTGQR